MLELKDRLPRAQPRGGGRRRRAPRRRRCATMCSRRSMNLGYHRPLAEKAVDAAVKAAPDGGFERTLKQALRELREVTAVTDDRLVTARARRRGRAVRSGPAPARARRLHRPGPHPREPAGGDRRGAAARRGARSRAAATARPGLGKTTLAYVIAQRAGRAGARDVRAGDREAGRPGRHPHQPRRRARCCSSTRSTGCRRRSRRSSIRRSRTTSSTS